MLFRGSKQLVSRSVKLTTRVANQQQIANSCRPTLGLLATETSSSSSSNSKRWMSSGSASPSGPKSFKVLGLQQVAIGGLDKSALSTLWEGVFGLTKLGDFKSEKENVDEDILRLGKEGPHAVEIDIMQPIDPNKAPKVHVPNLNHIGLWIDDLDAAYKELEEMGVRFTPGGIRKGAAGYNVCFVHPKGNDKSPIGGCGVLIELVQAPPEVIEALK